MFPKKIQHLHTGTYDSSVVHEDNGTYYLTVGGMRWMEYNPTNKKTLLEFSVELELAYGHCVVTGLGLGIREAGLAQNPKVTKITVVEKSQDVVEWFKASGADLSKFEFIVQDADTITGLECDCLFLDHYDGSQTQKYILSSVNQIASNNKHKVLWFWPLLKFYVDWLRVQNLKCNEATFDKWTQNTGLNKKFPNVDKAFLHKHVRLFFCLPKGR